MRTGSLKRNPFVPMTIVDAAIRVALALGGNGG